MTVLAPSLRALSVALLAAVAMAVTRIGEADSACPDGMAQRALAAIQDTLFLLPAVYPTALKPMAQKPQLTAA